MWPWPMTPAIIAIFIPIIVVIGVFVTVIVGTAYNSRRRELEHKERMLAMEKGLEIPEPPPKGRKRPRYLAMRAWGIVLVAVGISLIIGIMAEAGFKHGLWGLFPMLTGVALLISAALEKAESAKKELGA